MFVSKLLAPVVALAAGFLVSTAAIASPDCTTEPKDKWLSEEAMKAQISDMGYQIDVFKVEDSCYEIYGYNKEGKAVEVYFNPVSGAVVEEEIEEPND